jgi:hypothetical protein
LTDFYVELKEAKENRASFARNPAEQRGRQPAHRATRAEIT